MELNHIAGSADPQFCRRNPQAADDQGIASTLTLCLVMRPLVQDISLNRAKVLLPLLFDVDQRPLTAAKHEVLKAGELEVVRFAINHPLYSTDTPAGMVSSSTVTL